MDDDVLPRIRRFNRAVTREIGALDDSFLGRGRPLGVARVLHAAGQGGKAGRPVGEIRDALGLDPGLLSRILARLAREGLLTVGAMAGDGRRRSARLTAAGRREVAAYDRLSDRRAARLVDRIGGPDAELLAALDRITAALNRDRIAILPVPPEDARARTAVAAYATELNTLFDAGFDVAASLNPEDAALKPPLGAFLLAEADGAVLGCIALKGNGSDTGEVKRLWVAPGARGLGLARRLLGEAEAEARRLGMRRLRLDTNRALTAAIRLYRAEGWREIPAFNAEPYAHHWFEKRLPQA